MLQQLQCTFMINNIINIKQNQTSQSYNVGWLVNNRPIKFSARTR